MLVCDDCQREHVFLNEINLCKNCNEKNTANNVKEIDRILTRAEYCIDKNMPFLARKNITEALKLTRGIYANAD